MTTKIPKKIQVLSLQSILAISAIASVGIMISSMPDAYAYYCPDQHSDSKCYATHIFNPDNNVHGLKAKSEVKYHSGSDGTVTFTHWVFLTDGDYIEVGWQDTVDDANNPHYVCGYNGDPVDTWGSPSDNTAYVFEVEDTEENGTWDMWADGTTDTNCDQALATSNSNKLELGYEITHNDEVNLESADSTIQQFYDNGWWFLFQSSYGTHTTFLQPNPMTAEYYVDYCGTGAENYYHTEHGKGSGPGTC